MPKKKKAPDAATYDEYFRVETQLGLKFKGYCTERKLTYQEEATRGLRFWLTIGMPRDDAAIKSLEKTAKVQLGIRDPHGEAADTVLQNEQSQPGGGRGGKKSA